MSHLAALVIVLATLVAPLESAGAGRAAGPQDRAELESFLDGLLGGLMQERHIPGAVMLVVKDGTVFFAKGYGLADVGTRRPVDPATTLFRIGSVSKLFTATAAMQLVEAGTLDLHTDVQRYLDRFSLRGRFEKPVTLANLLTHTAGFDDRYLGSTQPLDRPPIPLGDYLAARMPPRVMPPGELISYSNHGLALAGYLVERASGQPFAEYVRQRVFEPLGMSRSGFGLPVPPPAELAVPYDYRNGTYVRMSYDRLLMGPAGDVYTSASDMARFMIAHLQDGRLGTRRILGEQTAREMHRQQFTHHARQSGWCYGFAERRYNDVRTIGHGGDWRGFGTQLVLLPDANLGLFVSTTRSHDRRFFHALLERFFDRYFPRAQPLVRPAEPADFATRAPRFTGSYIPTSRVRGDFLKVALFESESRVTADADGSLVFRFPRGGLDPLRLVEVEPLLFQVVDTGRFVSFRADARGRVTHLFVDGVSFDKVGWLHSPRTHEIAIALSGLVFLASVLGWTGAALVRRIAGGPASSVPRTARRLGLLIAILDGAFQIGFGAALPNAAPYTLFEGVPGWLVALGAIPLVSVPLSVALPYVLLRAWGRSGWTPLGRLHYAALTLAALLFDVWVYYWNLIGIGLITR